MYALCVKYLGRLPYEVFPEAPDDQVMLALAMLDLDAEDYRARFHKEMTVARRPPKWRKIHALVDRTAAVLRRG